MALGTISKIAQRVAESPPTVPACTERIKNFHFSFVSALGKRVRCATLRLRNDRAKKSELFDEGACFDVVQVCG